LLTFTSASTSVFETAQSHLGVPDTSLILGGLKLTTNFYLGGVFANGIILALCIVGFLFMLTFKTEMFHLLLSWFLVGSAAVLFASGENVFNRRTNHCFDSNLGMDCPHLRKHHLCQFNDRNPLSKTAKNNLKKTSN